MRKRIVFLLASLRGGGAERVFVLMANEMASRGHDVTLLAWNAEGPNAALIAGSVKLIDFALPLKGEGYGKPTTLKGLTRTARLLRSLAPDAVFSAPEFVNLLAAAALILARSRARFFPTFHAASALVTERLGARIAHAMSSLVAARATKAIAVSAGVGRELEARGYPASKVAIIHNPLPQPVAAPEQPNGWRQDLAAMGDGPVIVTAGRLVPVKDHRTLIQAFALLRAKRPTRLVIFGEGPLDDELRMQARQAGIGDAVLFAGYVNDPHACYAVANLFVLSSTSEGFGNVLVEAMAAGVPVVSTDAPHGPREILDNGRYGMLVPVGDAPALAEAMAHMLDHPTPRAELKRRATDFDIAGIGDLYEALLA
ncbi:glycosyl transferase [Brucella endophytica]|uniref:Glycosyl transferase n=1 Tax=Brucella endophytica TaxID=1963359 RepID=A0A916SM65_9HYPH|nr:glycosyltransferase [Brucella endophytica]GGB07337.1 glycosyl transferase [Brucella endophytica]